MAVHTLHSKQILHSTPQEAWDFFSDPRNLPRITPPDLGFEILTPDLPPRIYPGLMIAYRVRPFLGLPLTWLTEIALVEDLSRFIDEQRIGPYAVWHHEHRFRDLGDNRVEMQDLVTYALPFAPIADLAHRRIVRPRLHHIFAYRERVVRSLFTAPSAR